MSNFPTSRMVGKVGLESPVNAANPALKQRPRGRPFVKRTRATLRANPGASDKATLTAEVLLDGEAETLALAALIRGMGPSGGRPMTDAPDHPSSDGPDLAVTETLEKAPERHEVAEDQAFAMKLAKRRPPNAVELAAIEKARRRTKARAPRIAINIEDRGTAGGALYPDHCDEEGHRYQLADTFGTRSLEFVRSMLNGLGIATADHLLDYDFNPGRPNQVALNAALAVISGVRPKDEIEAMLGAHMALTNIALLDLFARTRGSIANHKYEGDGIKRLDVLGNLTNKFMRTYIMQIEALARKRRKGEQHIRVKHVHVYAGGQAIVGNVSHRGGRGSRKNEQQAYERGEETPTARAIPDSPAVWSANKERAALPLTGDEKGTLSVTRRRKR